MYEQNTSQYLKSPINEYTCKRITKQNIINFGFESIEELLYLYPNFPLVCEEYANKIRHTDNTNNKCLNTRKENNIIIEEEYNKSPKICICGEIIPFIKRKNKFCSRKCANRRSHTDEIKLKISKSLNEHNKDKQKLCSCGNIIKNKRKIICESCQDSIKKENENYQMLLRQYRNKCAFKFNIYDYREEFNVNLIDEYGWYSPTNKKNNLNGVSRDHIFSIKEGYDNGIDPSLLRHPANCQLLRHPDNFKKKSKSEITLEELLERIQAWNSKYPTCSR